MAAWLCLALGVCVLVGVRVVGWQLTEGELLVAYWPQLLLAVALLTPSLLVARRMD